MAYNLADVFIGEFETYKPFGAQPDVYDARFNLKGHNGIDFATPSLTMILAAWDGTVIETGFDTGGYGNFIRLIHEGYQTLYGHLNDITVTTGDKVVSGSLIGHSNNTGVSDIPHLHFAVAPTDEAGRKTEQDNGYGGYIDPMSTRCEWHITRLKEPNTLQVEVSPPLQVDSEELSTKSTQANSFKTIYNYIKQLVPDIDLDLTKPESGKLINQAINELLNPNIIKKQDIVGSPGVSPEVKKNRCRFHQLKSFTLKQHRCTMVLQ